MSTDKLKIPKVSSNGTQATVLKAVREYGPISRSGIVSHTGLPHAAVSRSVAILLEKEIVTESPLADTNGPRRKRGISLNPKYGYFLAVEYGPSKLEGVVVNTAYRRVLAKNQKKQLHSTSQDCKIDHIKSFTKKLKEKAIAAEGQCLGLAIIDPGIVDEQTGTAVVSSTMENWSNVPIVEIMEDHFDLPVMLLNTSMAKIRAIDRLEFNGASRNLIYIEYGEGIGCGLKLEGNYITGQSSLAGELGHLRVTDKPIGCRCGGLGCLESVAALPALARNAAEAITDNSSSTLSRTNKIDGPVVLTAAADGDRLASHIVDEAFDYLGRAVAGIVNVVNPQIIVFDHMISRAGDQAIATLMRSLQKNTLSMHWENIETHISKIDSFIGPLGGAASFLDECLEN